MDSAAESFNHRRPSMSARAVPAVAAVPAAPSPSAAPDAAPDTLDEAPAPEGGDESAARATAHDSGMRERETTPAPPSVTAQSIAISTRPTSVPDFDVEALAGDLALRHDAASRIPTDVTVPIRTGRAADAVPLRLAFVLMHVDGVSTISQIAAVCDLTIPEIISAFVELTILDLVDLSAKP